MTFNTIADLFITGLAQTMLKLVLNVLNNCIYLFFKRDRIIRIVALTSAAAVFSVPFRLPALADASATNTPFVKVAATPIPLGSVNIPSDGKWHFDATPYVFGPQINGKFQVPVPALGARALTISPHEPLSSYFRHINALSMITAEARRDRTVFSFDYMWLNISSQKTLAYGNAGLRITANVATLEAGATVAHSDNATLDTLIGVRTLNLNAALNWNLAAPVPALPQSGTIAKSTTLTDVVAAVRGKARVGNRFFVPYYFDGGYGSGSSTVQAAGGLAYEEPWGNLLVIYRALIYNANPSSLNQRLTFNGLAVGATYKL